MFLIFHHLFLMVICRAYHHQQVPIQMSSTASTDMPEYSNLPQPRQQASIASAAAAVATSTSFNSKRSRHSSLWSLQDEEDEQDHSTTDMVNYVNDPFGGNEFASQMMMRDNSEVRSSFQQTNSRHSASNEALN